MGKSKSFYSPQLEKQTITQTMLQLRSSEYKDLHRIKNEVFH